MTTRPSEADLAYFARIGAAKAESHAEATRAHRKLSIDDRLRRSWQLSEMYRGTANIAARKDDPSEFYELAKRLGLYRGGK